MNPQARKWAAAAALVMLLAGATLAFGQVTGTFAIFTADVENPNAVAAGGWIPTPTSPVSSNSATPWSTEHLTWTTASGVNPPNPNRVTGTTVLYADGGAATGTASCPTTVSGYTSFSTGLSTGANVTGTNTGDWWCFAVESTSTTAGTWATSDIATFTARRIFYASNLNQIDGGSTNTNVVGTSDSVQLTFNQDATLTGTIHVAICNTQDTIMLSKTTTPTCGGTANIGILSGQTQSANRTCTASIGGSGSTVITLTYSACTGTSNVGAGTEQFTPASTGEAITSAGGETLCISTAAPDCTPSTTNRY